MFQRMATRLRRRWVGFVLSALFAGTAAAADIKIASVAPDGSHWIGQMRAGAEEIRMRTGGRVTFKFYPGGVMGNDAQVLRKIRAGQLHGGAFASGGLAERYSGMSLYGIPLLFRSQDEVDTVRAKIDPLMAAGLDKAGFVSFGFTEGGFANPLSNEPIHNVDEMRRKKVWVPDGDQMSFLAMESMGLSPVVLPGDRCPDRFADGADRDHVRVAGDGARVAMAHEGQIHHARCRSRILWVFLRSRRTCSARLTAGRSTGRAGGHGTLPGQLDREARDDNRKAANEVLAKARCPDGDGRTPATSRAGGERSKGCIRRLRARPDVDVALFDQLLTVLADYRRAHPEPAHGGRLGEPARAIPGGRALNVSVSRSRTA